VATFVTELEYEAHTGLTFDGEATWAALDAACDTVRDYICQQVDAVEDDVLTVYGSGTRALTLPELPVTAVTSVTLDGAAITDFTFDEHGLLWRDDPGYWVKGARYVVTYDHGYAAGMVPSVLVRAACQLAASNRTPGLKSRSAGPFSEVYDDPDTILASLNRRVVKKIPMP
jgi:hypothetical protein